MIVTAVVYCVPEWALTVADCSPIADGFEIFCVSGPVGWIHDSPQPGTVALYRCLGPGGADHLVSTDPSCEGWTQESLLGYALLP